MAVLGHGFHHGITLGMHSTGIQGILGIGDAQETSALSESGGSEAWYFLELCP